ncbi:MAG: methylated-DNA--[protein]-cysteine S-methyltransferase [Pseudonocardiaceae bacterium]
MAWTTVAAPAPLGQLTLAVTEVGVAYLSFGPGGMGRLSAAARRIGTPLVVDRAWTDLAARQLGDYLTGSRRTFDVPVDWSLTSGVQRSVLATLHSTVGYGDTVTYGELAARSAAFDAMDSARAVGSIMGSNPIPVIVPCHRVLAADGLGGFGGGLEVKRWLLALEGVLTPSLDFETS